MFYDLCVRSTQIDASKTAGYDALGIVTEASGRVPSRPAVPMQNTGPEDKAIFLRIKGKRKPTQIFQRLTIVAEKVQQIERMPHADKVIRSFDVISIVPMSQQVFRFCCTTATAVDIISVHSEQRLSFVPNKSDVDVAISKGVHFEICYGAAIRDTSMRRFFISNLTSLVRATRGRNIILSSGSSSGLAIRSPYDVMNLGVLCGMTFCQAKNALSVNCERALGRARDRALCKGFAAYTEASGPPSVAPSAPCTTERDDDTAGDFIRL